MHWRDYRSSAVGTPRTSARSRGRARCQRGVLASNAPFPYLNEISMSNLLALLGRQAFNIFSRGCKRWTGPLTRLVLSVDECHISETDESEDVTQIGFLEIKLLCGSALFIGAASRRDDNHSFPG